jgi:DNA-binding CsgD family transcriptional regulator
VAIKLESLIPRVVWGRWEFQVQRCKAMPVALPVAENQVVPRAASASWRTWLMTGTRQEPIVRRRVRGAHKGLKRLLVEGTGDGREDLGTWRSFSGSMVRQAVEEAVGTLPPRQKQLIKLAYFSDLSNREIAQGLGITVSSVERGLREAIARVSEHVERGRAAGRKAIYALAMFLGGRWLIHAHQALAPSAQQWVKAGALVLAGATAGAVLTMHPTSLAPAPRVEQSAPAIAISQPYSIVQQRVAGIRHATNNLVEQVLAKAPEAAQVASEPAAVTLPAVVTPPISVKLPPLAPLPIVHGLLGA